MQFLMNIIMSFFMIFVYLYDQQDGIRGFKAIWGIKGKFKARINFGYIAVIFIVLLVSILTICSYTFSDKTDGNKVTLVEDIVEIKSENEPVENKNKKLSKPNLTIVSAEKEKKQKSKEFFLVTSKDKCNTSVFSINEVDCKTYFEEGMEIYNRTKACLPSHSFYGIYYSREAYSIPLYIPVVTINGQQYFSNMKKFKLGVPSYTLETALVASCNIQSSKKESDIQKATNKSDTEFKSKENESQSTLDFSYRYKKINIVPSIEQCSENDLFQCNESFNYAKSIYDRVKKCFKNSELYGVAMIPNYGHFESFEPAIETPIIKIGNTMLLADGTPFESGMQINREMFERNLLASCKE